MEKINSFTDLKYGDVIYDPGNKTYFYVHSYVYSTYDEDMVVRIRPYSKNRYDVNFSSMRLATLLELGYYKV